MIGTSPLSGWWQLHVTFLTLTQPRILHPNAHPQSSSHHLTPHSIHQSLLRTALTRQPADVRRVHVGRARRRGRPRAQAQLQEVPLRLHPLQAPEGQGVSRAPSARLLA